MKSYVVVSAVKNEEKFIEKTIESVTSQTLLPAKWVIVNDGSSDSTAVVIERYFSRFPWIEKIDLPDRGLRAGKGPAEAFNQGLARIKESYDFIVNLDGDVSFGPDYFEKIMNEFDENPRLGIASGRVWFYENEKLVKYRSAEDSTIGASKVYRRECFLDIGGKLEESIGWDMVDDLRAQMKGWETRSFEELRLIHYKPIGARQGAIFSTYFQQGKVLYGHGYHPLFLIAKAFYRGIEKPYGIKTLALILGYFYSLIKKDVRMQDRELMEFLKKKQLKKLGLLRPERKKQ